jgi:glycosyltransferase involved in cell wall biosynthesis
VASSDRAWQKARELVRQAASLLPVLDPGQRLDGTDVLSSRAFEMLRRAAVLAGTKFPKKTIPWKPANGLRTIGDGRGGLFHICLAPRTDLHLRVRKPQDALLVVQGNPLAEQQRTDFSLNETFIGSHVFSRSRGADALVLPLRLAAGDNLLSFSFHGVQNAARRTVMFLSRLSLFSDDVRQWSVDSPRRRRQYGKLKQEPAAREVAPIAPKTHRISVVIPCRNSGATLERTIRSLLEQNYPDLEIILMDGASIDETGEIIQRYRDRLAVVERGPDGGQVDAINHGFRLATGELRGWLCADDELLPGCLHEVNRLFDSHPESGVVSGGCERVYADRSREITRPPADVWSVIGMRNPLEQPSTFWRTDLHKRVGELDAGYELVFDWDLWARFAEAGARIATTSHPLSRYHFSEDNKTSSAGSLHAQEGLRIIRRYGPLDGSVADAYQILYHFDLLGCLDRRGGRAEPVTGTYRKVRALLASIVGQQSMDLYNLHFASLQERGLVWWR